jgi:hypothetical protein
MIIYLLISSQRYATGIYLLTATRQLMNQAIICPNFIHAQRELGPGMECQFLCMAGTEHTVDERMIFGMDQLYQYSCLFENCSMHFIGNCIS